MQKTGVNIVNKEYEHINFDVFSDIAGEAVSPEEKRRLMEPFYQMASAPSQRHDRKHNRKGRQLSMLAAACLIVCLAVTPLGEKAWAAVKQTFMGIGHYLGMSRQDDYVTTINQTQSKNGVTVSLCEAIGSDYQLRISFRATKDGKNMGDSKVDFMEYSINGYNWHNGLKATGSGPFGTDLPEEQRDRSMHFWSATYEDYEMPVNPTIKVRIAAGGEEFDFSFTLENEAFKAATKRVDIDKTITFRGKPIILKQLIITPIEQVISFENPEGVSEEDLWRLTLYGDDQDGDPVFFNTGFGSVFYGTRENQDHTTYMLDTEVKSYTLKAKDQELPDGKDDIGGPFTIQVREE